MNDKQDGKWETVNSGMMVAPGESIPATHLVAAAYGFIWLMVLAFVLTVWRRSAAIEQQIADLHARIQRSGGSKG